MPEAAGAGKPTSPTPKPDWSDLDVAGRRRMVGILRETITEIEESFETFSSVLRFRAPHSLEARLQRIANHRVKKLPEIAREAVVDFVEREERRLGLVAPAPAQPVPTEAGA